MGRKKLYRDDDLSDEDEGGFGEDIDSEAEEGSVAENSSLQLNDRLLVSDDESDEAPEDVSLAHSRQAALHQIQGVLQQLRQEKNRTREKRRQQHELYTDQKKKKNDLDDKRLPQAFLDNLPSTESRPQRLASQPVPAPAAEAGEEEDEDGSEDVGYIDGREEFIQLDKNAGIKAVSLTEIHLPKSVKEKALAFRNQQLYGPNIRRESAKNMMSKKRKRVALQHGSKVK